MRRLSLLAVLLVVAISAVVLRTAAQRRVSTTGVSVEKWEYLVVAHASNVNFTATGNPDMRKEDAPFAREGFVLEQHLDKLGRNGWELVSVAGTPGDPIYYFKRPGTAANRSE